MQLFRTIVPITPSPSKISFSNEIMLMGSCFSESIGQKLIDNKFEVDNNPFGIVYNPLSISTGINKLIDKYHYTTSDLFYHHNQWNSFDHHSRFSNSDAQECVSKINQRIEKASERIRSAKFLFITFGSAWVYFLKSTTNIVSNCHKLPASDFLRKRITIDHIAKNYSDLLSKISVINPALKIVFTVSPVRHWADGAHENQLSKSTLLLAINEICQNHANAFYFPSYELMMDDLRDYRFYNEDMIHPSTVAIEYIWEHFSECFFTNETRDALTEIKTIVQASKHRPFQPQSEAHQKFCSQMLKKIDALKTKHNVSFHDEEIFFRNIDRK